MMSWHAAHNMVNDYQDLNVDDVSYDDSYRLSYGVHVLRQGFLNKAQFLRLLLAVAAPGMILSTAFRNTPLGRAFGFGFAALVAYTPLFKPFALGEVLVYFVWGPLMAGFGTVAAGATLNDNLSTILSLPSSILFGTLATQMIFGKHTDKIAWSEVKTLPKLLGPKLAVKACYLALVAPYVVLIYALSVGRLVHVSADPILPMGASLAFLAAFKEARWTAIALSKGMPTRDKPTMEENELQGTLGNARIQERWPLWFVQFLGWHSITFGYLSMVGSGIEWALRAITKRIVMG